MRKVKFLSVFVLLALLLSATVGGALAAGTWYWYDVTMNPIGGSVATNNETKLHNGQATVSSNLIGADYTCRIRLELVDNTAKSGWYVIDDGTFIRYNNTASASDTVHMRLKNWYSTPVHVQANGHWSPDTP